jgi:8-hydroxy-5-deazaflavin:NADPH oxidoreductase
MGNYLPGTTSACRFRRGSLLDSGSIRSYAYSVRIAIVGAGRIGGNAARLWSRAGHDVIICFSRHPDQLAARAAELGDHVGAASPAHAVADADVVMLAVPWDAIDRALDETGSLAGKVVLDATNQFGAGPKPAPGQTVAQFNSARLPGARYVRGFNTLTAGFQAEASSRPADQRAVMFVCGDFPAAKDVVVKLIEDAGFAAVDLGSSAVAAVMEAPRRRGSVYGEEYRLPEARAVAEAVHRGGEAPPARDDAREPESRS